MLIDKKKAENGKWRIQEKTQTQTLMHINYK